MRTRARRVMVAALAIGSVLMLAIPVSAARMIRYRGETSQGRPCPLLGTQETRRTPVRA